VWFIVFLVTFSCNNSDDFEMLPIQSFPDRQKDFSLWQLDQFNFEVQMCYIVRTDDGKITVVDGGMPLSSEHIKRYVQQLEGRVHTWVVTHPHEDHIGVLMALIADGEIKIDRILHSRLDTEWVLQYERGSHDLVTEFYQILEDSGIQIIDVQKGESFQLGEGVELKVLQTKNEIITENGINNSSVVFKISSISKSVLFLGDLGYKGGEVLLKNGSPENLKADYVQMAHHGQNGVDLEFYKAVKPDYALWPTPKWLWQNKAPNQGPGTGNYQIPQVISWMENEIGVKKNYVAGLEGNLQID